MKFKFKIQKYQTDAVEATADVFAGQPNRTAKYTRDLGFRRVKGRDEKITQGEFGEVGERNAEVELSDEVLLDNICTVQSRCEIPRSEGLVRVAGLGKCSLDIEMETGTGKTYVYVKTMFELNKRYGWNKFIVVVPSIAIREGVKKSFSMLEDHFMEAYGKKARYFVYSSGNLTQLDSYSQDAGLNVMIINTQAFASSFKEGAKNKEARIIYSERDDFASRRPIDVIAANRPIIIMDEPQKMEGKAAQDSLKRFKPLFVLNYSATHRTKHNCVYALDALDAYRQRLVKKIEVKSVTLKNLLGSMAYVYFDEVLLSKDKPPMVRLEIEVNGASGPKRKVMRFGEGDSLYDESGLNAYEGWKITEIDATRNIVRFQNGESLRKGEVTGDVSESAIQQIQIRETIKSHLLKEKKLLKKGIKVLSLFFIDEVKNYKAYNDAGEVVPGPLWEMFEKEYVQCVNECKDIFSTDYNRYLDKFTAQQVHNGYFSIDPKTGRVKDSEVKRGSMFSDDVSAYDLILKDKERLLSFAEPTRFIFSHSALREGWDNPNVFQICTLRHADSSTAKRQEVGRGLRICVDGEGNRMDAERLGDRVHDINKLTVIANESYGDFVDALQKETSEALRERPKLANAAYFTGKTIKTGDGDATKTITKEEAEQIFAYLFHCGYIDIEGNLQAEYGKATEEGTLAPLNIPTLASMEDKVHALVAAVNDPNALKGIIVNGNSENEIQNRESVNFQRKEFRSLWDEINHKYVYTVHYDSDELIHKVIWDINANLSVTKLKYIVTTGEQGRDELGLGDAESTRTKTLEEVSPSEVEYDLVGEIAKGATLTRRSVAKILKGIYRSKLALFANNPEEFIRNVVRIIREQKATMIVEHISYNRIEGKYDSDIFTQERGGMVLASRAYPAKKHVLDYVAWDSEKEKCFAKDMDAGEEVCVYAKLPRSFHIPTPVGNYAPDWAVAFNDNMGIKHVFFIAETKGSMSSMDLRPLEKAKIRCAKKLFEELSHTETVRYHEVTDYQTMLQVLEDMK